MLSLNDFFAVLNKIAPIEYSYKLIEKGDYDNSGILVNIHENVEKVLFSLDLTEETVKKAKRYGCDTVVTHHPVIYTPLKNIGNTLGGKALSLAVQNELNVISMHLNLDVADGGIDASLCEGLGGKKYRILDNLTESVGYGREFSVENKTLAEIKKEIKKNLNTNRIISYGKDGDVIKKAASFCGGGSEYAVNSVEKGITDADLIISSDIPHHNILKFTEAGKDVIVLTHYCSENYGFKKFFEKVDLKTKGKAKCFFFEDKRFM